MLNSREAFAGCTRHLSSHVRRSQREWLELLAGAPGADELPDVYNTGVAMQALETEVAGLLGKPAARFVVKATMAQQALLRVWTDRSGVPVVALPARCHIEVDEDSGYRRLHGLQGVPLGDDAPFTAADLDGLHERLGVVVVELPLRNAGSRLLPWDDLVAVSGWCRAHGVPLHLDGARLWEAAAAYERPLAAVAALADSVYVSFYKGIGGLGGCAIAGEQDVIDATRPWTSRHGGNLFTAFPFVLSAREGLRTHLPRMPEYVARARTLAAALGALPGVTVIPDPPHTNMFQLHLAAPADRLTAANLALAESDRVQLFFGFGDSFLPGHAISEVTVGSATDAFTDAEAAELVGRLVEQATAG